MDKRVFLEGIGNVFSFTDEFGFTREDKFCRHYIIVKSSNTQFKIAETLTKKKCDTIFSKCMDKFIDTEKHERNNSYVLTLEKDMNNCLSLVKYDYDGREELDMSYSRDELLDRCISSLKEQPLAENSIHIIIGDIIFVCDNITCGIQKIDDLYVVLIHTDTKDMIVSAFKTIRSAEICFNAIKLSVLEHLEDKGDNFINVGGIGLRNENSSNQLVYEGEGVWQY